MRSEQWIVDGFLEKKAAFIGEKFVSVFATIDYKRELVRFKKEKKAHQDSHNSQQMGFFKKWDIPFAEVSDVVLLKPDFYMKETGSVRLLIKTTGSKEIMFRAKNTFECEEWLSGFQRIV